jgi:hypothetical protein
MVLADSMYRVHVNITYTTAGKATSAASAINSALSSMGRSETCTVNGSVVDLLITQIPTESEAISIRDGIKAAWSGVARTGGKAAVIRSNTP